MNSSTPLWPDLEVAVVLSVGDRRRICCVVKIGGNGSTVAGARQGRLLAATR